MKTIGIIGSSDEEKDLLIIAEEMGKLIAENGLSLITGGRNGVMRAASKGAYKINKDSKVIGILPGIDKKEGNDYLDYAIPTGIGWARNQIVVLSSDILVAIGGGAGTLSEIAYAWAYKKPIIAFKSVSGWSKNLAGKSIDERRKDKVIEVNTPTEAIKVIRDIFSNHYR